MGGPDMAPQTPQRSVAPRGTRGAPRSPGYFSARSWLLLRGVVNLAEVDPPLAVELGELLLLDRVEVRRPGVDLDTRQQHRQPEILQARGLLHDVGTRKIAARLLEHLNQSLRHRVTVDVEVVDGAAVRVVLLHERQPLLVTR